MNFRGLTQTLVMDALSASIINEATAVAILQSMYMSDQAIQPPVSYTQVQRSVNQVTAAIAAMLCDLYPAQNTNAATQNRWRHWALTDTLTG